MENKIIVLGLLLAIVLVGFSTYVNSTNKLPEAIKLEEGWEYRTICSSESFFAQEDADKGWYCLLEDCRNVVVDGEVISEC